MIAASTQQSEALRLADALEKMPGYDWNKVYCEAAFQLRHLQRQYDCLHTENEVLKLQITSLRTPLTTDQKLRIALDCNMRVRTGSGAVKYATAIEAAHGIGEKP